MYQQRIWRKFYLAVDAATNTIVSIGPVTSSNGDADQVRPLLEQTAESTNIVMAHVAYDVEPPYRTRLGLYSAAMVVIPLWGVAVLELNAEPTQPNGHNQSLT